MDNFITNLKNKLMLPDSESREEEPKHVPIIPMLDVDNMMQMNQAPARAEPPALDVTHITNEPHESKAPMEVSSKTNFKVKSISSEKVKEPEPHVVANPIEDDVFINYD